MSKLGDYVSVQPKSKIKAGEGLSEGEYKFFTSSNNQTKWLNQFQYNQPALIFGTGGMASVHYCDTPFSTSTDCIVMYAKDNVNLEYVYRYLESHMYILENGFKGVGLKHISKDYILSISIPVIDSYEQDNLIIKAKIIDTLIQARTEQIAKLDKLVKARFVEIFGEPVTNPKGWQKRKLSEECDIVTGNTPSRKVSEYYGNYIEWIKSDNINTPNTILTRAEEFLSQSGLRVGRCVDAGAILMTCIAGSIGCIGNVAIADRKVAFNQQINAIVPKVNNTWFMYVLFELSKKSIQNSINMSLKGILSKGQLSEMEFIFPPIELQNQFAVFVKRANESTLSIQKSLDKLELLKASLMQQYFG